MNYDAMAEGILLALRNHTARLIVGDKVGKATLEEALVLRVALISSKLKELFPVPEDLETAVREAVKRYGCDHGPDHKPREAYATTIDGGFEGLVSSILFAVTPLLAERDERIKELKKELSDLEDVLEHIYDDPPSIDWKRARELYRKLINEPLESPDED